MRRAAENHMTVLHTHKIFYFRGLSLPTLCVNSAAFDDMRTLIFLTAAVAVAVAFDFPEEWELWKRVWHRSLYIVP